MNREDLGKMLERNLSWPAASRTEGEGWRYRELVDDAFQRGAEGFWNDVIDALVKRVQDQRFVVPLSDYNTDESGMLCDWLEDQKIAED